MRVKIIILLLVVNVVCESYNQIDCGTHKTVRSVIIGGDETVRGEHPWKAALTRKNGKFFCGGSLVSNNAVLTAAHCIKGKYLTHDFSSEDITVILGSHDLSKTNESGRETVGVTSIQVHPDWNIYIESYDGDIALLMLETQVQFTSTIQPICLSKPQSSVAQATEGIIIGYGKTESTTLSNIAKKLKAQIKRFHHCVNEHQNLRPFLTARTFCGGSSDGKGVCEGDSGSGLYVLHNNRFYLRGTTSASAITNVNECDVNTFAIFVDTTEYCGWIRSGGLNKYAQCSEDDEELIPAGLFGFGGYRPGNQNDYLTGQGSYRSGQERYRSGQGRYTPSTQDDYRTELGSYRPGSQYDYITGQGSYRPGQGSNTPSTKDDFRAILENYRPGSQNYFGTNQGNYRPGSQYVFIPGQGSYTPGQGRNTQITQNNYRTVQGSYRPGSQNYFGTNQGNYRPGSQNVIIPGQGSYITGQGSYRPGGQNYFGTYQGSYRPDSQDNFILGNGNYIPNEDTSSTNYDFC